MSSSPATSLALSPYKSRTAIRNLLKSNKRLISDDALIALINSIEDEQFGQFLDIFTPKTSLKALNEPVKTLLGLLQTNEDLLEKMYDFWKSISNIEYNQEAFIKWFFDEKLAFLELTNDLISISYDSENSLSEKIKPIVDRMIGKKLHTKILSAVEGVINREEQFKFAILRSLLKTLFLLLYQKLRKESSFASDSALLLPKIFKVHYLPQDQPLVNYIFDLTAIIGLELLDFESLRSPTCLKIFNKQEIARIYDEWGLGSIDPSNSVQGLGLMTWCHIAQDNTIKGDLGTRAYQGGAFFRLYSILSNGDLISGDIGLMCKTIIKDFISSFFSSFDVNAMGNLQIIVKCLLRVFSGEEKLSVDLFESQDRFILDVFLKKFPHEFVDLTKILASLANGHRSNEYVYDYLAKMTSLCLDRTPDRGLVKETLQDGAFHLSVSRNFEAMCNGVGFYLVSGTKGISFRNNVAGEDAPTVYWQVEFSGWHYFVRLVNNNPTHQATIVVLSLLQQIYSSKLIEHFNIGMPIFTDVKTPDLSLSALSCIILNRDNPLAVYSAFGLLNKTPVNDALRRSLAQNCILLNSVFEFEEEDSGGTTALPLLFCQTLNLYSILVKRAFSSGCTEDLERFVFGRLFGYMPLLSFEGNGLDLFCASLLNMLSILRLTSEKSLLAFEFARNCIIQNVNYVDEAVDVISRMNISEEAFKRLISFEVVEKILEKGRDPSGFITNSLEKNHFPLSSKSLEFLADLLLRDIETFALLLEKWPQIILALFSSSFPAKFSSAFVSLLKSSTNNDKLIQISKILLKVWTLPTIHYLIICKLRGIREFWKAIEDHISKSGVPADIRANLLRLYSSEVRLEPKNTSIYEFLTTNPELVTNLLKDLDPIVCGAFIDLLDSISDVVPLLSDRVIVAIAIGADGFIVKHPDLLSQGMMGILKRYSVSKRDLFSWEALTILFVERLNRELTEFCEVYFECLKQANVLVSKSLLVQSLSLCCHLKVKAALLHILEILILSKEYFSTEIMHIIQRDRAIPILMSEAKLSQDVLECFIRCGENSSFSELLIQNGVIYACGACSRDLLLSLIRIIGKHGYTETLLGALYGMGLEPFDEAALQTVSCLLGESTSIASPVVSSFIGTLIPVIFSTLRKIGSEGSGDAQPYVTFLKNLQKIGFVQEEHINNGVDQVYDPPIPYRDILLKVTVK